MEPTTNEQSTLARAEALGLRASILEGRVRCHELGKEEYLTFPYEGFLDYLTMLEANATTDSSAPYDLPRPAPNPFAQPTPTPTDTQPATPAQHINLMVVPSANAQLLSNEALESAGLLLLNFGIDTAEYFRLEQLQEIAHQLQVSVNKTYPSLRVVCICGPSIQEVGLLSDHQTEQIYDQLLGEIATNTQPQTNESTPRTDYVLGFAFTPDFKRVLLRKSNKLTLPPLNDDHLWSGVATVYPADQPDPSYSFNHAMAEAFEATTGLSTNYDDWIYYSAFPVQPTNPTNYQIHLFYIVLPLDLLREAESRHPGNLNCIEVKDVQFINHVQLANHVQDFIQSAVHYHHSQPSEPEPDPNPQ